MPQKRSANRINTLKTQAVDKLTGEGGSKVELEQILERLAEQVEAVDAIITPTQTKYIPSIGTSSEPTIVQLLVSKWAEDYPEELPSVILKERRLGEEGCFEIRYPENKRHYLDFGFSSSTAHQDADNLSNLEWAIEFKKINWCGDTGVDMSERAVGKLCSPYPSTGPILEDALRVSRHSFGKRHAVILLSPDIHPSQLEVCKDHPDRERRWKPEDENDRYKTLSGTFRKNNGYAFTSDPLLPFVEKIFEYKGIKYSEHICRTVTGLTRHPVFSRLTLVGWEIQ